MILPGSATDRPWLKPHLADTRLYSPHSPFALHAESGSEPIAGRQQANNLARLAPLIGIPLSGCGERGAPSFVLAGAYFPAWMLCALIAIAVAIAARAIFVVTGLTRVLPFQLFVCSSIGICFALLAMMFWFD
jgi:hypothetical protein